MRRGVSVGAVLAVVVGLLVAVGPASAGAAPVASDLPGGTYVPVTPARVLDTRSGLGAAPGATTRVTLAVGGSGGVPTTGVAAVVLNLTVTGATRSGYLVVSPEGSSSSSNVNYTPGRAIAQLAVSKVDASGRVVLQANTSVTMIADVVGWFTDSAHADAGATYRPTAPRRLYDTRSAGQLVGGAARRIPLTSVPAGATAVAVNLTTIRPTGDVYVTAWGSGPRPATSSMNTVKGDVRSNRAIVPIAPDRSITVFLSGGRSDLVVDLSGWFTGGGGAAGGSRFVPVNPTRLADTRGQFDHNGYWSHRDDDPLEGRLQLTAADNSPAGSQVPPVDALTPATAAWLTFTVVSPGWQGWLAVAPTREPESGQQPRPGSSDINFGPGVTPNAVLAAAGIRGGVSTVDDSGPVVHREPLPDLVIDLAGIFTVPVASPAVGLWRQGRGSAVWGNDVDLWTRRVPGVTGDVVEVAGTISATAALLRDGTVLVRRRGEAGPTVLARDAAHVTASGSGFYVIARDGTVRTDDGNEGMHGVPGRVSGFSAVPGVTDAVSVSVGVSGAQAVRGDGSVVAWGGSVAPAASVVVQVAGPVQAVAVHPLGGRSVCRAYRDGSVEVRYDSASPYLSLPGIDAVTVLPAEVNGCFALDRHGVVHRISTSGDTPVDTVLPGVEAVAITASDADVRFLGDYRYVELRVLAADGTVWDRVRASGGRWQRVPELDGTTVIGGGWSYVAWIPPAA